MVFLAVLVINRVWFLHSNVDVGIEKKINKSPSQIVFTVIKRWSELGN